MLFNKNSTMEMALEICAREVWGTEKWLEFKGRLWALWGAFERILGMVGGISPILFS
jgi:hypothetical protein